MSIGKSSGTFIRDSRIKEAANELLYCIYQCPSSAGGDCIMMSCGVCYTWLLCDAVIVPQAAQGYVLSCLSKC